jgi:molybdopterin-guanine dinucleotide biosynthesis protein B
VSMARFETVVIVDWSAAAKPTPARPSTDAIWIGVAESQGVNSFYHRTRAAAEIALIQILETASQAGRRVLLGFDFPFGYPHGFAERLTGTTGAPAIWTWMQRHVIDGTDNANNRFALADQINAGFGGAGPFWGRPSGLALRHLTERKTVDYRALGLIERRQVEIVLPRSQPVWKLYTTGSVGSQSMMGLPVVARLTARFGAAVWPFDACLEAPLVLAEVYPSLIDPAVQHATTLGEIKDAAQVRLLAHALWQMGQSGNQLEEVLKDVPEWPGRADEGWILGAGHAEKLIGALR